MKVFKTQQVREIDNYTIENEPIASIDLMERASRRFVSWFIRKFDISKKIIVFAGPGNNGGDGLAVARLLAKSNYSVEVYLLKIGKAFSEDCAYNLERLRSVVNVDVNIISDESQIPELGKDCRIIDAIFGSGLTRPVEGLAKDLIAAINSSGAMVISIDIPSGLFGEDNSDNTQASIIKADYTISFEFPFLSFFFSENEEYTGKFRVVSIGLHPEIIQKTESDYTIIDKELVRNMYKKRSQFSHKGSNGHALIISGCYGMMGAAVLANRACLRTGTGLVTAHVPRFGYNIIQSSVPEALISLDQSDIIFTEVENFEKHTALAIGPGLNCKSNTSKGVMKTVRTCNLPMVIDADALNILSSDAKNFEELPLNSILTPHPGEFDRMTGPSGNNYERHKKQLEFSAKYKSIVVLKGRYTIISTPAGHSYINMTGNPGLATGGSGDVLTGIIVGLLAQGYSAVESAVFGVYLHGLAADIALKEQSYESLLPTDVIENLGAAFKFILTRED